MFFVSESPGVDAIAHLTYVMVRESAMSAHFTAALPARAPVAKIKTVAWTLSRMLAFVSFEPSPDAEPGTPLVVRPPRSFGVHVELRSMLQLRLLHCHFPPPRQRLTPIEASLIHLSLLRVVSSCCRRAAL